jgi:hypothetical protein
MINPNETSAVLLEVDERKVVSVIFNRPAVNVLLKSEPLLFGANSQ